MMITFAVGDVHGCAKTLENLLNEIGRYIGTQPHKFVFLGDYIDRGSDSKRVIDTVRYTVENVPGSVALKGNHEDMLLHDHRTLMFNGGIETCKSFGVDLPHQIPQEYLDWVRGLPLYHEDALRFYVHAGVSPCKPLETQKMDGLLEEETCLWIRDSFLKNQYFGYGKLIVHGHTPVRQIENLGWRLNIDTACVFGEKLTAAIFNNEVSHPIDFIQVKKID